MKPLPLIIAALATVALTIASGVMAGKLTDRWGSPGHLEAAAKRLEAFPDRVGQWRLQASEPLSKNAVNQLQCAGYVQRLYVNEDTGETLSVALIVGPYGPMTVHNPDICYPNMGYASVKKTERYRIGGSTGGDADQPGDHFWVATFKAKAEGMDPLHVYYAWSRGRDWKAPNIARIAIGGSPVAYRLQVSSRFEWSPETEKRNGCVDFLTQLMPIWHNTLAYDPASGV